MHTVAHEFEHVRQNRVGIADLPISEFLGERVEILSKGMDEEDLAGFMNDARRALRQWNLMPAAQRRANFGKFVEVRNKVRARLAKAPQTAVRGRSDDPDRVQRRGAPEPMTLRLDLAAAAGSAAPLGAGRRSPSRLTNAGPKPVLINRRMSPGYQESISREIYFDLDAEYGRRKYDRDISDDSDYAPLDPDATVSTTIDLLHWYRITEPGSYRIVGCYQCDEPGARPPAGVLRGVARSRVAEFTVQ